MITARFRRQTSENQWIAAVSQAFPDATFRLLSGFQNGDTAVEIGECITESPEAVAQAAREHPAIESYDRLEATDRRLLAKYVTTDVGLYRFVEHSGLALSFPVVVKDGWSEFDFSGTREDFERVRAHLEETGLPYDLLTVVESTDSTALLTTRQREVLETALRRGYLAVPRECTLAELAETLDIDPSTASGIIRRGAARVLERHLAGPVDESSGQ